MGGPERPVGVGIVSGRMARAVDPGPGLGQKATAANGGAGLAFYGTEAGTDSPVFFTLLQ